MKALVDRMNESVRVPVMKPRVHDRVECSRLVKHDAALRDLATTGLAHTGGSHLLVFGLWEMLFNGTNTSVNVVLPVFSRAEAECRS
jgi:hypothetical protein